MQVWCLLILLVTLGLTASCSISGAVSDRAAASSESTLAPEPSAIDVPQGYTSPAGAVLGTYQPKRADGSSDDMASAAKRFLLALTEDQRQLAHLDLTHPERKEWSNIPARGDVGGIAIGSLNESQLHALFDLLASLLSEQGYQKIRAIMLGDDLRSVIDGQPNDGVGVEAFRFVVFGDPSASSRWAVQLDGHHIALNITLDGDAYSMSPTFIGTFPQEFTVADETMRPMAGEVDLAHTFVNSLSEAQRQAAVVGDQRGALRAGRGQDGVVPAPVGMRCDTLDDAQASLLTSLVSQWLDVMPVRHAEPQRKRFLDSLDQTWFSWNGPLPAGSDISYAIQSPSMIIEFANDERGGSDGGNPVDHVHTMYRDFDNEYGDMIQ